MHIQIFLLSQVFRLILTMAEPAAKRCKPELDAAAASFMLLEERDLEYICWRLEKAEEEEGDWVEEVEEVFDARLEAAGERQVQADKKLAEANEMDMLARQLEPQLRREAELRRQIAEASKRVDLDRRVSMAACNLLGAQEAIAKGVWRLETKGGRRETFGFGDVLNGRAKLRAAGQDLERGGDLPGVIFRGIQKRW